MNQSTDAIPIDYGIMIGDTVMMNIITDVKTRVCGQMKKTGMVVVCSLFYGILDPDLVTTMLKIVVGYTSK
jgi:hypothetical protein